MKRNVLLLISVLWLFCSVALGGAFSYQYDEVGSIKKVTYPNDITASYSYDSLGRLTNLTYKNASESIIAKYDYTFYADGMRSSVTELDGTTINWEYDNINRLTKEVYDAPGTNNDYIHRYTYDLVGNRMSRIVITRSDPQFPNNSDTTDDTNYQYNLSDQLTSESTNGVTIIYGYDVAGAMISKQIGAGTPFTFTYNLMQRLSEFNNGTSIIYYKYNPEGIRVSKQVNSDSPIEYLIDIDNPTGHAQVFKEKNGSSQTTFIIGLRVHDQCRNSDGTLYYIHDALGSVRYLANESGDLIENYHYDAFGNILSRSTSNPTSALLYRGEWWDSNIKMYYLRQRYYEPTTGRLNQTDPAFGDIYEPLSLQKYNYAYNNPVNYMDPSGLMTFAEIKVSVSIMVSNMGARVGGAFATGGAAVGRLWNQIGSETQRYALQTIRLFLG